ncbi:PTS sugar transporter subunit IIA [Enterococcus saccharolyticus]|uniref:PTS mannose/fructose/sorbose family IIA subunit n=1 Tax=Candidatus Enterococcus willemsii TaxID=1857215 RepID=A0ABQ6Z3C0_9ENTE|nr:MULTISPECIES: PTS sugar transporter subunit IIA [Enterococcus]KAF1306114.1 PTS mannose/fructose/sorbose family IIA subunit [Enterococcus sp. CU12B]MCD5002288.1 PTS sugar transporter subunit IIA [Enterococcus saccharolyticus]
MTNVLLVAHGKLATEMKNSAEMIFGELPNFYPIEFLKEDGFDSIKENALNILEQLEGGTLVVADLFGGTPFNACCGLAMEYPEKGIEVLSGMSLPLVLEVAAMQHAKAPQEIIDYLLSVCANMVKRFVIEEEEDEF